MSRAFMQNKLVERNEFLFDETAEISNRSMVND